MRYFVKRKPPPNDEITLSFTDIGKSCCSREILKSQICLLSLFAKINSRGNFEFTVNCILALVVAIFCGDMNCKSYLGPLLCHLCYISTTS